MAWSVEGAEKRLQKKREQQGKKNTSNGEWTPEGAESRLYGGAEPTEEVIRRSYDQYLGEDSGVAFEDYLDRYLTDYRIRRGESDQIKNLNTWAKGFTDYSKKLSADLQREGYQAATDYMSHNTEVQKYLSQARDYLNNLSQYQSAYESAYGKDGYQKIVDELQSDIDYLLTAQKDVNTADTYWRQFKDEAAYNTAVDQLKHQEAVQNLDMRSASGRLDMLTANVDDAKKRQQELQGWMSADPYNDDWEAWKAEALALDGKIDDLESQKGELSSLIREGKQYKLLEPYYNLPKESDFAADSGTDLAKDITGEPEVVSYYYHHSKADSTWLSGGAEYSGDDAKYSFMTDEEYSIYNYLLKNDAEAGTQTATKFIADLDATLNQRRKLSLDMKSAKMAEKHPVAASIYSVLNGPTAAFSGLMGYAGAGVSALSGDEMDPNSVEFLPSREQQNIRNTVSEDMGDVGKFFYQTGMSMGDFMLSAGISSEPVALALMGSSAGTNATLQAYDRGATTEQALKLGLLAGAAEVVFEKISLDSLIKMSSAAARGALIKNALKQAGIEGSEEFFTEIANIISDKIVLGDLSQYKDASAGDIALQLVQSFAGGVLSGGLMGGGASVIGSANTGISGNQIVKAGVSETLISEALKLDQKTDAFKIATELKAGKIQPTATNVGRLYVAYGESGGDTTAIDNAIMQKQGADPLRKIAEEHADGKDTETAQSELGTQTKEYSANTMGAPGAIPADTGRPSGVHATLKSAPNTEIEISGISEITPGGVTVKTATGEAVNLKDVEISNVETAQVYNMARLFDSAETANAFIDEYDGITPVDQYYDGFNAVYRGALKGGTFEQAVSAARSVDLMSEPQLYAAYLAGKHASTRAQLKRGGVVKAYTGKLTKSQGRQVDAIDKVWRALGRSIVVHDHIDIDGLSKDVVRGSGVNAYFDPRDNSYHIALDSTGQAYMFFALHESIHDIRANNALGYAQLEKVVMDSLKALGKDIDALKTVQKGLYPNESEAYWMEEIVANTVPAILTDPKTGIEFAKRMAGENEQARSAFLQLLDAIKAFLKKAYNILKKEKSWEQMDAIKSSLDVLAKIREAYFAAFDEMTPDEAGTGQDIKLSAARLNPDFSEKVDAEANFKAVVEMEPVAELTGNEFKKSDVGLIDQVAAFFDSVGNTAHNPLLGDVKLDRRGAKDDIHHGIGRKKAAAFAAVPAVIEKGEIIDVRYDWKNRSYDTVVIAAPITIAGDDFFAGVVLIKSETADRFYVHEVAAQKNDGADHSFWTGTPLSSSLPGEESTPSLISILQKLVNYKRDQTKNNDADTPKFSMKDSEGRELTPEQAEYFKDSKVRDADGNLLVVYHGSKSIDGINVFNVSEHDGNHGRKQVGAYFTSDKSYAEMYPRGFDNPTIAAYLNIKNPLRTSDYGVISDVVQAKKEKLENEGYDGVIFVDDPSNPYYTDVDEYLAFYADQIKRTDNKSPKGSPDIRFSTNDQPEVDRLLKENEKLRDALDIVKEQFKLTQGHHVSDQAIERMGRRILKDYSSKYDHKTLVAKLRELFDYIGNADDVAWDEVTRMGVSTMEDVVEQSREIDRETYAYYADLRKYLKETNISLSDAQRKEATSIVDNYQNYRRILFGRVNLTNKGTALEKVWQELSSKYPEIFSDDMNPLDMPAALMDVADMVRPQYINPFGFNIHEAAYDLFLQVYDEYFSLPEVKTFADKKAAELQALKAALNNKIADVRQESKNRYMERLKELRAENLEKRRELVKRTRSATHKADMEMFHRQYDRLRSDNAERVMRRMASYRKWYKGRVDEKQTKSVLRKRIEKNANDLAAWVLSPTREKHVPELLRRMVTDFLESIDFTRNTPTQKAALWREKLLLIHDMAANMEKDAADYKGFYADFHPSFIPRLEAFVNTNLQIEAVSKLDVDQLKELDFIVGVLKRGVVDANKLHSNDRYREISAVGEATMTDLSKRKPIRARGVVFDKMRELLNIAQLDAFSYFDELGGSATSVLAALRRGFDVKIRDVETAMEYMDTALKGTDIAAWDKTHTFSVSGGELKLTTKQIMELYLLDQREQARGHIYNGGIRPVDQSVKQGWKTQRLRAYAPVKVSSDDVQKILKTLTPEQISAAEAMQVFVGDTASRWGNETAMTLYGYRAFEEEAYWPIKTDENYVLTQDPKASASSLYALRNLGMTKATVKGASNAIMLGDVFDTFSRHIDEMSSYHGLVVPLSDSMKWFNFKSDVGSVKQSIERVLGKAGKNYFINLIADINGISNKPYSTGIADMLIRNAKIASVGANLSVIIQQPFSYLRAGALIDSKYLAAAVFHKNGLKDALKYCPIALWKSWGFFDLNIGKSMRQIIVGDQNVADSIREKALLGAQAMDNITWGTLWNAAELEIRDRRRDLKVGSEEFKQAVGARLAEIVDRTQVVDSVFHRSQLMRSDSGLVKMYTAFMSEPTKAYNMIRNAIMAVSRGEKGAGKVLARTGIAFILTQVVNSAVRALMGALRDDDEDETFGQKYVQSLLGLGEDWKSVFGSELVNNLNPMNLIPGLRDIASIMSGFNSQRMDLKAVEDLWSYVTEWIKFASGDSRWSFYKLLLKTTQAISSLTGIPAGTLMKTVTDIVNTISPGTLDMENETATSTKAYEELYEAILSGDEVKIARIRSALAADKESPKSPLDIDVGIAKLLMANDPRIAQAYAARAAGDITRLKSIMREIQADGFGAEVVTKAINLYENSLAGKEEKDLSEELDAPLYDYDDLDTAIRNGNAAAIEEIRNELLIDSDASDPEDAIHDHVVGKFKDEYVQDVMDGNIAGANAIANAIKAFGITEEDMQGWVTDAEGKQMRSALDSQDVDGTNKFISMLIDSGRDDGSIKRSITKVMKDKIIALDAAGDEIGVKAAIAFLEQLELYNTDETSRYYGTSYYYEGKIRGWITDAKAQG